MIGTIPLDVFVFKMVVPAVSGDGAAKIVKEGKRKTLDWSSTDFVGLFEILRMRGSILYS